MNMVTVFLHQLQQHLKSFRFQVSFAIIVLFFGFNGMVYVYKNERLRSETAEIVTKNERRIQDTKNLRQLSRSWLQVIAQPTGFEFIGEGGMNWFYNIARVKAESGMYGPLRMYGRTVNLWMRRFEVVDWSMIIRYVVSFVCILLAYDSISREIEQGTLSLLLANPISRVYVFVGKYLAHLSVLAVTIVNGTLISLLILSLADAIALDAQLLYGYAIFLWATLVYVSMFLCLSMGVSAVFRSSSPSLVMLVLFWTCFIVFIPQISYIVGVRKEPVPNFHKMARDRFAEYNDALKRDGLIVRAKKEAEEDDFQTERKYMQGIKKAETERDKIVKWGYDQQLRQYKVAQAVNLLSPGFVYQYCIEALLRTGISRYENFLRQAWTYRDDLRKFIRVRDAADPQSPHLLFLPDYLSDDDLRARDIPRFKERPIGLADSVREGVAPLLIFVLSAGVAFFFALAAFNRTDITNR